MVVLTGAGISAASGVPTFRGSDGLWNKFRPEELASMDAFLKNPELVWEWYAWRRRLIHEVEPNLGHYALVDIENYFPEFTIVTQNVDDLHRRAGSRNVTELHGNIMVNRCISCAYSVRDMEIPPQKMTPPACPECGGKLRPGVVWFGELLPQDAMERAQQAVAEAEILLAVGTSSMVEPAASLPYLAKGNGAYVVEINPEETPLTAAADEHLAYGAEKVLPILSMHVEKVRRRVT